MRTGLGHLALGQRTEDRRLALPRRLWRQARPLHPRLVAAQRLAIWHPHELARNRGRHVCRRPEAKRRDDPRPRSRRTELDPPQARHRRGRRPAGRPQHLSAAASATTTRISACGCISPHQPRVGETDLLLTPASIHERPFPCQIRRSAPIAVSSPSSRPFSTPPAVLDLEGQKRCLDFMIDAGSDGLCILANFSSNSCSPTPNARC